MKAKTKFLYNSVIMYLSTFAQKINKKKKFS